MKRHAVCAEVSCWLLFRYFSDSLIQSCNFWPQERNVDGLITHMAAEIEALRDAYAALNRNDIPAFVALFDPQIERIEPSDFPQGGTYRGIEAVKEHVAKARATWAEGSCEPKRFIAGGDRVIVFIHVQVRLKHETEWREGDIADVYTFRNGKQAPPPQV